MSTYRSYSLMGRSGGMNLEVGQADVYRSHLLLQLLEHRLRICREAMGNLEEVEGLTEQVSSGLTHRKKCADSRRRRGLGGRKDCGSRLGLQEDRREASDLNCDCSWVRFLKLCSISLPERDTAKGPPAGGTCIECREYICSMQNTSELYPSP